MSVNRDRRDCPGCGLAMPLGDTTVYDGYFNTSPECWSVFTEVVGHEFGNAVVFGQVHQLTVDAYAVQHAGGSHPDKSIAVHLVGASRRGGHPGDAPPLIEFLEQSTKCAPA